MGKASRRKREKMIQEYFQMKYPETFQQKKPVHNLTSNMSFNERQRHVLHIEATADDKPQINVKPIRHKTPDYKNNTLPKLPSYLVGKVSQEVFESQFSEVLEATQKQTDKNRNIECVALFERALLSSKDEITALVYEQDSVQLNVLNLSKLRSINSFDIKRAKWLQEAEKLCTETDARIIFIINPSGEEWMVCPKDQLYMRLEAFRQIGTYT
ncbi:hypothetical protein CAL7716_100700 (plasmid) [Calothrix sp. PCC 7716]|nr:hypothetical protein CAL7716_100700 [Calothrix sp. PCC 7716]